jgi:hypothetical protein
MDEHVLDADKGVPNEDRVEGAHVPNRGEGEDADDEVVVPNKEELVFDVEEEPNVGC